MLAGNKYKIVALLSVSLISIFCFYFFSKEKFVIIPVSVVYTKADVDIEMRIAIKGFKSNEKYCDSIERYVKNNMVLFAEIPNKYNDTVESFTVKFVKYDIDYWSPLSLNKNDEYDRRGGGPALSGGYPEWQDYSYNNIVACYFWNLRTKIGHKSTVCTKEEIELDTSFNFK